MKVLLIILTVFLVIILAKTIWVAVMTKGIGSFETERKDILSRRNFLLERVITEPQKLIEAMPSAIGAIGHALCTRLTIGHMGISTSRSIETDCCRNIT